MQSPRGLDALVPKPRGNLPYVIALALAAVIIGANAFQPPERLLGLVAGGTLDMTIGSLLYGLCLLPEEMLHHANTRHGGRVGRMIVACGLGGRTLLALLLSSVILHLSGSPLQGMQHLLLAPGLYVLLKGLGVLGPSEVEVSDICEKGKMNVAHGLAWSFYLGYLRLVLPRLVDSIEEFKATHQASLYSWDRGSMKLVILVPLNANISHKLEDEDTNIRFYDNLPNNEINRAGVRGRVYKHSVYSVQDAHGKSRVCAVEYATPLLTLYQMSQESSAGFGERERRQQVLLFFRTLQEILESSLECRNRYTLILLNDEHDEEPHLLSKVILRHLQQQEEEEFCLDPPGAPQQEEACSLRAAPVESVWSQPGASRDPSLMISLEPPQPLREAVENTHQTK